MKIDIKPIKFVIQLNEYTDDEIGHGEYVVIDGQESEDVSAGFMVLNSPNQLFELRDAIDEFINRTQISRIISHE